jgi:hypothetical protein
VRGWLPPAVAREGIPLGAVRPRKDAVAMAIPLSTAFRSALRERGPAARERADPCWSSDHI